MTTTDTRPTSATPLRAGGVLLETGEASVGELRDSSHLLDNIEALRERMAEDGYLLLRGFHDRGEVLAARREVVRRLDRLGFIKPGTDPMAAIGLTNEEAQALHASNGLTAQDGGAMGGMTAMGAEAAMGGMTAMGAEAAMGATGVTDPNERPLNRSAQFMPDQLAADNEQLDNVIYGPRMMGFFERFFGEPAKHYGFTWFRSIQPGSNGTPAHTDVIFMGRAEREQLYTAWTPIGDIDYLQGGLIVLEDSHKHEGLRNGYSQRDADSYCVNKEDKRDYWQKIKDNDPTIDDGRIASNVEEVRRVVGGRWLTTEFNAGDVLIFSVFTVHGSIDNGSRQIRLSSDSRYQPASKPADERWMTAKPRPIKRALIC